MHPEQPIGIFDSGIGGLTVAKSIHELMPNEALIYFGDTLHLPYGEKSADAIQGYCSQIINFLLEKNCKAIVIACHSASSVVTSELREHIADSALLFNVIDPVIHYLHRTPPKQQLGLIGTKRTIRSKVYEKKLHALNTDISLQPIATPLLAAAIEEDFKNPEILESILHEYLDRTETQHISDLVLGCTHYPIIRPMIESKHPNWNIIDPAMLTAKACKDQLQTKRLLTDTHQFNESCFYASDITSFFRTSAEKFFGRPLKLEKKRL